jgi:hypothetical protein
MPKRNHTQAAPSDVRILKAAGCPSLSGKSKLRYEIGASPNDEVMLRICANSAAGYFNDDWIPWTRLVAVLEKHGDKPITCFTLEPLLKGRSANTSGFLLAALKNEGLVQRMETNKRCYERLDGRAFIAEVQALIVSSGTPGKAAKAVKPVKVAAAVKKALPSRK